MKTRSDIEQVWSGLRLALGVVTGFFTMLLLGYGLDKLRFPETDNSVFTFLNFYPPRLVGGVRVAAAVAILWGSVNRWAKFLPGFCAYAVFGGLLAVARGGFHSRIPALSLTRIEAAIITALYGACAFLTWRFANAELNWVDRMAALSFPILLLWAGTSNDTGTDFKMLSAMVIIFAAASAYSYLRRRWHKKMWKTVAKQSS